MLRACRIVGLRLEMEMRRFDEEQSFARRADDRGFDRVGELPNVARPLRLFGQSYRSLRGKDVRKAMSGRSLVAEEPQEVGDVFATFGQGRNTGLDHV